MCPTPTCGGEPITSALTAVIGDGVSLILVRSTGGYCFSSWSRYDERAMPLVSAENKLRAFATEAEAVGFFRTLFNTQA